MAEAQPVAAYTYEEYLALEQSSQERYEYYFGKVRAMAGGTRRHSLITLNLLAALKRSKKPGCLVYGPDMKLELLAQRQYYYPDLMLTCQPDEMASLGKTFIRQPVLIGEVLSDSTEDLDRNGKFKSYMAIPSLRYYVLISQHAQVVEVFSRQSHDFWHYRQYSGRDAVVDLAGIGIQLNLADIYEDVPLDAPADPD
ncbi:MAG: Uma2 family endonuclease [Bacteroidia bacterium]|nr:Uma2 family endonuclease [Bacteroidia bacterium]